MANVFRATSIVAERLFGVTKRAPFRFVTALAFIAVVGSSASPAWAAVYYVGSFAGSAPSDDPSCGTGKGGSGQPHPCASLAYWTQSRRASLHSGDAVRFAASDRDCIDAIINTGKGDSFFIRTQARIAFFAGRISKANRCASLLWDYPELIGIHKDDVLGVYVWITNEARSRYGWIFEKGLDWWNCLTARNAWKGEERNETNNASPQGATPHCRSPFQD